MLLSEAVALRESVEHDIMALVQKFKDHTGLDIGSLELKRELTGKSGSYVWVPTCVKVRVEL